VLLNPISLFLIIDISRGVYFLPEYLCLYVDEEKVLIEYHECGFDYHEVWLIKSIVEVNNFEAVEIRSAGWDTAVVCVKKDSRKALENAEKVIEALKKAGVEVFTKQPSPYCYCYAGEEDDEYAYFEEAKMQTISPKA